MGICAYDDFYSQLTRMQMVIGSIGIVMIIIASIAVGVTMLLSLRPLKNVKEAISDVATGDADLTKRITKRGNDEIADVVVEFKEGIACGEFQVEQYKIIVVIHLMMFFLKIYQL